MRCWNSKAVLTCRIVAGDGGESYTACMELTLTPEMERNIQREIELGRFSSPLEVVATALDLMHADEDDLTAQREMIASKLTESFAAAERGEILSSEEFLAGLDEWRASVS